MIQSVIKLLSSVPFIPTESMPAVPRFTQLQEVEPKETTAEIAPAPEPAGEDYYEPDYY